MKFGKNDPMYYRETLKKLLNDAKTNHIELKIKHDIISFTAINECYPNANERTCVNLGEICKEQK